LEDSNVRASRNSLRAGEELPVRDSETEWIKIAIQEAALSLEERRYRHCLVRLYGGDRLVEHSASLLGGASLLRECGGWERESRCCARHKWAEHSKSFRAWFGRRKWFAGRLGLLHIVPSPRLELPPFVDPISAQY